ncbi:hypothetical protein GCM10020000_79180 [Streptomyces olivoverticillatus]
MVEDSVHPAGCQFADLRGHVADAVVDRDDAQLPQGIVVPGGGRADHLHARRAGELGQDGAHAAAGAVDQDGLPRAHPSPAVQHLPGRDAVDHDGLGLRRRKAVRYLDRVLGVDHHMAGPPTDLHQCGHPPADQARVDALAGRQHAAHQVVAGHEGERRLVVVPPAAHLLLGERDAGRLHGDHDLSPAGVRYGCLVDLQAFRSHEARQNDLDAAFAAHDRTLFSVM